MRKAKSVFCIVLPQALSPSTIVNPLYSKIFNYLPLREREREKKTIHTIKNKNVLANFKRFKKQKKKNRGKRLKLRKK